MPGLAGQGWTDSLENYVNGYSISINGTTATAAHLSEDVTIPCVLYGISLALNPSVGSGQVTFKNGRGTGSAGNVVWRVDVPSAAASTYVYNKPFARGLVFSSGLIVSALTITGTVNLSFKQRYDT